MTDVGTFRIPIRVAHVSRPDGWRELPDVMVDTGSEYNWIPRELLLALRIAAERAERFETRTAACSAAPARIASPLCTTLPEVSALLR